MASINFKNREVPKFSEQENAALSVLVFFFFSNFIDLIFLPLFLDESG